MLCLICTHTSIVTDTGMQKPRAVVAVKTLMSVCLQKCVCEKKTVHEINGILLSSYAHDSCAHKNRVVYSLRKTERASTLRKTQ